LNPALQDRNGQPKRDITTIIHILNDLLCAQYKNYRSHEPKSASSASGGASCAASAASAGCGANADVTPKCDGAAPTPGNSISGEPTRR
jgi:hypothetical protein